jgi:hypothetical protein
MMYDYEHGPRVKEADVREPDRELVNARKDFALWSSQVRR